MKLIIVSVALFFVSFGTVVVWALCGDSWQLDTYSYTPSNQTAGQVYARTVYFTVCWTDNYGCRSNVAVTASGQWSSASPPAPCNPDLSVAWDTNTVGYGAWSVRAYDEYYGLGECRQTGNYSTQTAKHYCNGCGDDERPSEEMASNEIIGKIPADVGNQIPLPKKRTKKRKGSVMQYCNSSMCVALQYVNEENCNIA